MPARLLLLENENLSRLHLKNISASVKAGTFTAKGEHVSIEEFGALLDFLRPKISFPVAPFDLRPLPQKDLVPYEYITTPAFSWRWWDLPIPWVGEGNTEHNLFPLPIAKLQESDDINGCRCVLSASALWHLLPIKDPVAKFFAQVTRTKARWVWWRLMLDIGEQDVVAPPKSSAAKARAKSSGAVGGHFVGSRRPSDDSQPPAASDDQDEDMSDQDVPDAPGNLKFAQWMVTPRMFLGALMWIGHVQRTPEGLQDAAFAILKNIVAAMPPEVALDVGRMKNGSVAASAIKAWLETDGLLEVWYSPTAHIPGPPLDAGVAHGSWLLWFVLRHWEKYPAVASMCRSILKTITPILDDFLATRTHETLPTMRLPPTMSECFKQVRQALRGEDKRLLAYNTFLGRNTGYGVEDDHALKTYIYDPKLSFYHKHFTRDLLMSYYMKVRSLMVDCMQEGSGVSGDFLYWDASRVASKEVLLVHAWVGGHFVAAPLQILPDQTSVHSPEDALANVASVLLPLSVKQQGGSKPRRRLGEATQSLFYSIVQALKVILPVQSLLVWKPSSFSQLSPDKERVWCQFEQQEYLWHKRTHKSEWVLPRELHTTESQEVDARILVVVADEGSTGWSLFQWLALKHRMRVF